MKKVFRQNEIYVFFIMIALTIVISSINRYFFTLENLFDLLRGHSFEGILAIGFFMIPTMITTLGTLTAFQGALMSYLQATHQTVISNPPQSVINFGKMVLFRIEGADGKILELSIFALIFIGVALVTWIILK